MNASIGELAAIGTSLAFSASSLFNTLAGRQVGAAVLNRSRLIFGLGWLILAHLVMDIPLPFQAGADRWLWLSLSGIVGLAIGDAFLFQAFIWIGPRLSMLMMALAPALAALMAWVFLGEVLTLMQWSGIGLALFGIALVTLDRKRNLGRDQVDDRRYRAGLLFGFGAAIGQAAGTVLAKRGLGGDFPALSGTLIRMSAAAIILWGISAWRREIGQVVRPLLQQPRAAGIVLAGSIFGPFIGVTLSLYAVQHTAVGVASTLSALPPIFLLPAGRFLLKETFGWESVMGTFLVIGGVALFFLG